MSQIVWGMYTAVKSNSCLATDFTRSIMCVSFSVCLPLFAFCLAEIMSGGRKTGQKVHEAAQNSGQRVDDEDHFETPTRHEWI